MWPSTRGDALKLPVRPPIVTPFMSWTRVVHYCVTNMPGAMPRTSTIALTNATLPYARRIAALGLEGAIDENPLLRGGVNTFAGHIVCKPVAESLGLPWSEMAELSGRASV